MRQLPSLPELKASLRNLKSARKYFLLSCILLCMGGCMRPAPPLGAALGKHMAYDIIVCSPYTIHATSRAASSAAGSATLSDEERLGTFEL